MTVPTHVPADESPAATCPYCDRPFRTTRARDLHVGERHGGRWTQEEQAAYEAAIDAEADDLFIYHLKVIGALSVLYSSSIIGYMVVLGA